MHAFMVGTASWWPTHVYIDGIRHDEERHEEIGDGKTQYEEVDGRV